MDMSGFLQIGHQSTVGFFYENLMKVPEAQQQDSDEGWHVASFLAHFAETSVSGDEISASCPGALAHFLNNIDFGKGNPETERLFLLNAAAKSIFWGGFNRDLVRPKREAEWYDIILPRIYKKALPFAAGPNQQALFAGMAESGPIWTIICRDLCRSFRDNRYEIHH